MFLKDFYCSFLSRLFISKFFEKKNSSNFVFSPFSHIILRICINDLKDDLDLRLLNSFKLLKELTGQQPHICYLINGYKKGSKVFRYSCKVTLRKKNIFYFLNFFISNTYNYSFSKRLILNKKFDKFGNCFILFSNINFLRGLSDTLYLFKEPIFFEFYSSNLKNKKLLDNILYMLKI